MTKNMNDLYQQAPKGMLSSSIKRTERQIESQIQETGKADEKLFSSLENRVNIFIQRFNELPEVDQTSTKVLAMQSLKRS